VPYVGPPHPPQGDLPFPTPRDPCASIAGDRSSLSHDAGVVHIAHIASLRWLTLAGLGPLKGHAIDHLSRLKSLTHLDLSIHQLQDKHLAPITRLSEPPPPPPCGAYAVGRALRWGTRGKGEEGPIPAQHSWNWRLEWTAELVCLLWEALGGGDHLLTHTAATCSHRNPDFSNSAISSSVFGSLTW